METIFRGLGLCAMVIKSWLQNFFERLSIGTYLFFKHDFLLAISQNIVKVNSYVVLYHADPKNVSPLGQPINY